PYNLNRLFLTGTIPVIPSILTDSMKPHYIYSVKGCIYFDRSPFVIHYAEVFFAAIRPVQNYFCPSVLLLINHQRY
ncbi:hypothetical protein, partial [Dehalobacter sp. TeCB1]|uniref:hypothetical protein n=1 Tax=Dehalobacter sp. TeCB1 TaxID=1843715 RepID=UPI001A9A2F04